MKNKTVNIVTCTGYYGTGSSAITDLIGEYDNVYANNDYEIRFVMDPNGISDLEYNLIENPNRHNTSHALKKYKNYITFLNGIGSFYKYRSYFKDNFYNFSIEYINNLTVLEYRGNWHYDVYEKGKIFTLLNRVYNKFKSIFCRLILRRNAKISFFNLNNQSYCTITDEEFFLFETKKYTNNLFNSISDREFDYISVDQLVPPSNIVRYIRYFDSIKVIVVDRDPRDLFILEKEIWKGTVVPDDIESFCKWFKWTRNLKNNITNSNVLKIKFEDLIYNYSETVNHIEIFLNISSENHQKKKTLFDPSVSIANTQLWKKYKKYDKEVKIIEKNLSEYCYEFPSFDYIDDRKKHIF